MYYLSYLYNNQIVLYLLLAADAGIIEAVSEMFNAHPAIFSSLAGITAAVAAKYVDKWWENRTKGVPTGDKVLDAEAQERKELREQNERLMTEKENFWKLQNDRVRAQAFEENSRHTADKSEARQINHAAINEIMRLHNIILGMQRTLVLQNLPVPEVSVLEITTFLLPAWEKERIAKEGDKNESGNDTPEGANI